MNKEEIEHIEEIKKMLNFTTEGTSLRINNEVSKLLLKYIKELEQKESILDKVIDKLKEIKRELNDDGFGYYAQEVTKTLNIIEGENNNGNV